MKVYRAPRRLLAEVERVLASRPPSFKNSPLDEVVNLLCRGRHYAWVGIFLTLRDNAPQPLLSARAGSDAPAQVALPQTRCKILISIRLASRELGALSVESERENAFGVADRVLLEGVADMLARFLAGQGKYLARKAAQKTTARQPASAARAAQPALSFSTSS